MNEPAAPSATGPFSRVQQVLGLLFFIAICFGAAGLGAIATTSSVRGWYQTLDEPNWTPPAWLFGPVWSALYLMMAIAGWLVWRGRGWKGSSVAMTWFGLQLALNSLWSIIFFGLHQPGWAFVEIIVLWLAIAATIIEFRRISTVAGWLLVPYLAWSTFAACLNFAIWKLNTG